MKKILAGLLLVNLGLFTTSVFAEDGCLEQFDKIKTNEVGPDGDEIYTCITTYKKTHDNICSPLFVYNGNNSTGFGCQLDKNLINKMCTDINGNKKAGFSMTFNLTQGILFHFPEDMKNKYKNRLNKTDTVITYKCETIPK